MNEPGDENVPNHLIESIKTAKSLNKHDLMLLTQALRENPDLIAKIKDIEFYQLILAKKGNLKKKEFARSYLKFISSSKLYADLWHLYRKLTHDEGIDSINNESPRLNLPSESERNFLSRIEKELETSTFSELKVIYEIIDGKSPPLIELQEKQSLINYARAKFEKPSPEVINFLCHFFLDLAKEHKNLRLSIKLWQEYKHYTTTGEVNFQEDLSLETAHIYNLIQAGNMEDLSNHIERCIEIENSKNAPDQLKLCSLHYLLGNFGKMEIIVEEDLRKLSQTSLNSPDLIDSNKKFKKGNKTKHESTRGPLYHYQFLRDILKLERSLITSPEYPQNPTQLFESWIFLSEDGFDFDFDSINESDLVGYFPRIEYVNHYLNLIMYFYFLNEIDEKGFQEKLIEEFDEGQKSKLAPQWENIFLLWGEILKNPSASIQSHEYSIKLEEIFSRNPVFNGVKHALSNAYDVNSRLFEFFNWQNKETILRVVFWDDPDFIRTLDAALEGRSIRYLEKLSDRGSTALIYTAMDLVTGEKLAIKVYRRVGQDIEQEFREIRDQLRRIKHPNVIQILSGGHFTFKQEEIYYFVEEFFAGKSLETIPEGIIESQSKANRIELAMMLANGIAAIHGAYEAHNDLHEGNVLISTNPLTLKVIDPRSSLHSLAMGSPDFNDFFLLLGRFLSREVLKELGFPVIGENAAASFTSYREKLNSLVEKNQKSGEYSIKVAERQRLVEKFRSMMKFSQSAVIKRDIFQLSETDKDYLKRKLLVSFPGGLIKTPNEITKFYVGDEPRYGIYLMEKETTYKLTGQPNEVRACDQNEVLTYLDRMISQIDWETN